MRDEYEARIDRFTTPETRTIEQLNFPDPDAARAAADRLAAGETFEALVAEQGRSMSDVQLGTFERETLPDQAIAEAAFSISVPGNTTGVVEGTFGPVIVRVTEITPQNTRSFIEVANQIRADLALAEAEAVLLDVHDAYEDARAGGATLQEAAKSQRLTPIIVEAVDRTGQTPEGEILRDLPESAQLIANAFDADINVETPPINIGTDGFLWFEVLDIVPARDRTLDEVRAQVIEDWKAGQAAVKLTELAEELRKRVSDGEELSAVAADQGLIIDTKYDIRRQDEDAVLGRAAVDAAFSGTQGLVAVADDAGGTAKVLMKVTGVVTPDSSGTASLPENVEQTLSRRMGDDMLTQAIVQMQEEFGVAYDPAVAELAISHSRY